MSAPAEVAAGPVAGALPGGRAALLGAVSAAGALAAAELSGLLLPTTPSPVTAVADRIVAVTPDGLRETLISVAGTADKPLLALGIVLAVVGAGAVIGLVSRSRRTLAPWLFAAGALLGWAVGTTAELTWSLLAVCAVGAAVASMLWLRLTVDAAPDPTESPAAAAVSRRAVLRAAGTVAVVSALGLSLAAYARRGSSVAVDAVRRALRIPAPTDPAAPLPAGVEPQVPGLAPAVTANRDFYQIDVALVPPAVDVTTWSLSVAGDVERPFSLSFDELLALPSIERYVTLTCVSNPVGGELVGNALWQGVRLTDLLDRAGVLGSADAVVGRSVDGFTAGFPLAVLDDGRDAMVAYAMNGEPLPVKHGFPARLVVPGLYGYVSATKWLEEIRLTTLTATVPFWLARGWAADGTIEAASRIDVPRPGVRVPAGQVAVGGRAWHQHEGIGAVEVSVDGGPWEQATLATAIGIDTWCLWSWDWDATPGEHELRVRMVSADGTPQDEAVRDVFPGAASGLHTVPVRVG
jgi:DMSO/TMAO reductase YedYZ molybdopterin-dependent catalytic subunit